MTSIRIMETEMKSLITIAAAVAIVLAWATAAFATASPGEPVHHHRATNHWTLAGFFDSAPPPVSPKERRHARRMRHEGLSRDPSDCIKYGCLGY
jgi:hypothetical protein